jgi:hypothetical protein
VTENDKTLCPLPSAILIQCLIIWRPSGLSSQGMMYWVTTVIDIYFMKTHTSLINIPSRITGDL